MEFNCFTIRDYLDTSVDPMYPNADEVSRSIRLTPEDGNNVKRAVASAVVLARDGDKRQVELRLEQIKAEIVVTDTRVAFAIPKYDKGGGWYGGATALALNAASKARAAMRSRGKCLVGHIHYPWLDAVSHGAYFSMLGNRKNDQIRLGYSWRDASGRQVDMWVELQLTRDVNGHALANEILQRAVRQRLSLHPTLDDERREKLMTLAANGLPNRVVNGRWTQEFIPAAKIAMRTTAKYEPIEASDAPAALPEAQATLVESEDVADDPPLHEENTLSTELLAGGELPVEEVDEDEDEEDGGDEIADVEMAVFVEAGWYADPDDDERMRYWDGTAWTDRFQTRHEAAVAAFARRTDPEPAADPEAVDPVADAEHTIQPESIPPADDAGTDDTPRPPAGWHADPLAAHRLRYWDGDTWTEHVAD
ncbi:MAG: DUF2510 domain-containing protein [Actinomycetota bacterium]